MTICWSGLSWSEADTTNTGIILITFPSLLHHHSCWSPGGYIFFQILYISYSFWHKRLTQKFEQKKVLKNLIFFVKKQMWNIEKLSFFLQIPYFLTEPPAKMEDYPPLLWSGGILSVSWRDMNMTEQGHWTKHRLGLLMQRGWNHGITNLNVIQTPEYI